MIPVRYDSDRDEEETASGVVVDIDGKEVHIGATKRKTQLNTELFRRSADYRRMMANVDGTQAPDDTA